MNYARLVPVAALGLSILSIQPSLAAGSFECPKSPLEDVSSSSVDALISSGDPLGNVEGMNAAVDSLRAKNVSSGVIIDGLVAAYCPTVAGTPDLTDAQKSSQLASFAARVARTVYSLESADEIILDIAFPPQIVNAIDAAAKAAGTAQEAWIRDAVDAALK